MSSPSDAADTAKREETGAKQENVQPVAPAAPAAAPPAATVSDDLDDDVPDPDEEDLDDLDGTVAIPASQSFPIGYGPVF